MDTTTTTRYNNLECMKYLDQNELEFLKYLDKKDDRPKLEIYPTELDIEAKKEDPNTECCICYINRNKVQFKPCNHILCIGCSNTIISEHKSDTTCPFCRGNVKENLLLPSAAATSWLLTN